MPPRLRQPCLQSCAVQHTESLSRVVPKFGSLPDSQLLPNSKPSHHQNSFDVEIVSNEKKIDVHSVFEVSRKLEKGGKLCSFFGHKSSLLNKVLPLLLPPPPQPPRSALAETVLELLLANSLANSSKCRHIRQD